MASMGAAANLWDNEAQKDQRFSENAHDVLFAASVNFLDLHILQCATELEMLITCRASSGCLRAMKLMRFRFSESGRKWNLLSSTAP